MIVRPFIYLFIYKKVPTMKHTTIYDTIHDKQWYQYKYARRWRSPKSDFVIFAAYPGQ